MVIGGFRKATRPTCPCQADLVIAWRSDNKFIDYRFEFFLAQLFLFFFFYKKGKKSGSKLDSIYFFDGILAAQIINSIKSIWHVRYELKKI